MLLQVRPIDTLCPLHHQIAAVFRILAVHVVIPPIDFVELVRLSARPAIDQYTGIVDQPLAIRGHLEQPRLIIACEIRPDEIPFPVIIPERAAIIPPGLRPYLHQRGP